MEQTLAKYVGAAELARRLELLREVWPGVTLEGASAIEVIGGALPKLTERGIVEEGDFPLMRHLHSVVALDGPLDIPWSTFFGGEDRAGKG